MHNGLRTNAKRVSRGMARAFEGFREGTCASRVDAAAQSSPNTGGSMAQRALRTAEPAVLSVRDQLRLLDDTELVTTFLKSEERAFDVLVERYQTRLLNFI